MMQRTKDVVVEEFSAGVRRVLGQKVTAIYWFGSRSRNAGHDDSDYDMFVESRDTLSEEDRDRVVRVTVDISGKRGVVMDVHYGTFDRLHGPRRFLTPFREAVLTEGVRV
jgi:predicted nucleotidyltransferase